MKIFFLLNPSRPKNMWRYRQIAARAAREAGAAVRFAQVERNRPQSTQQLLMQACEEGYERIVIVGGDGSLHRAMNVLDQSQQLSQKEIAVVPAGTCNDFARAIGLFARGLKQAFRLACTGRPREVDLGRMTVNKSNSILFINNAGFGRHAQSSTGRRIRPLQTLKGFRPNLISARWEQGHLEGSFYLAVACNAPFFSGGLHFSKAISVNDGMLNVFLFPVIPKWRLLPLLVAGKFGRPVGSRHMISLRVQRLEIESETDLWPQADGEPASQPARHVSFEIASRKVQFVVPLHSRTPLWAL